MPRHWNIFKAPNFIFNQQRDNFVSDVFLWFQLNWVHLNGFDFCPPNSWSNVERKFTNSVQTALTRFNIFDNRAEKFDSIHIWFDSHPFDKFSTFF